MSAFLIFAIVIQADIYTVLLTMNYLYFVFDLYGNTKVCFYLPIFRVDFFPWSQNEMSLALKAYPTYRWTAVLSEIWLEAQVFWLAKHLRAI